MSKIILAVLTAAAFLYAVWLVTFGRELPRPSRLSGLRRRFALATLLFVGLLSAAGHGGEPEVMCYVPAEPPPTQEGQGFPSGGVVATFQAAWRALDSQQSEAFRNALQAAAERGELKPKVADMLAVAYAELAVHKESTRPAVLVCYEPTPIGSVLRGARENALKQVELLEKAQASSAIDKETAAKAQATLARELEMLYRANRLPEADWGLQERLIERYEKGSVEPGDAATVASGLIVEMEGGPAVVLSETERLSTRKSRVEALLAEGPPFNDWEDPAILPNINAILDKAGLRKGKEFDVLCYEPTAMPVKERSEELKRLQRDLLKKLAADGVLDAETANKAAATTDQETDSDKAVEEDFRAYQEKVHRAMELLWSRGEVPSSFFEQVADAADIDIAPLDVSEALREDVGYYMRALPLHRPLSRGDVTRLLEKRKLIPPARNRRHDMGPSYFDAKPDSPERVAALEEFEALIAGDGAFELEGDANTVIELVLAPIPEREYRLEVRKMCRALLKMDLASAEWIREMDAVLGIPTVGVIKEE